MPNFDDYPEAQNTKMIYLGHTGAGKTGSLCSLAAAGYNVRIIDTDAKARIIKDYVKNPASPYRRAAPGLWSQELADSVMKRMSYVTITETVKTIGGRPVPQGDSWGRILNQLHEWKDGEQNWGNLEAWGEKDVLVIDSMSRLAEGAMNYILKMNARLTTRPEQGDWGAAQREVENLLKLLYSPQIKCNVIIICHIAYIDIDNEPTRGFPQTIGKALSPKVGQYFNSAILAQSSGQGEAAKRVIKTNISGLITLQNEAPLRVKGEYQLGTGLAEYFRDIRGEGGGK